ncbi:hypothetical protein D3C85_1698240 [compost metagenome]
MIRLLNRSILAEIAEIFDRDVAAGVFRPGIEPRDLHMLIRSFCFFRVSNRYTFATIHQVDFTDPETRARHKEMFCEAVLMYVGA